MKLIGTIKLINTKEKQLFLYNKGIKQRQILTKNNF